MGFWWFRLGALCQQGRPVNIQHSVAVERRLSVGRVVLALPSLAALLLWQPLEHGTAGVSVLVAYTIHSTALAVRAYSRDRTRSPRTLALHVSDVVWVVAVIGFTGGVSSPFFAFFIFALLAAGYRWGLVETVATGVVATLATAGDILARSVMGWSPPVDLHLTAARLLYLVIGGFLIGYLAEDRTATPGAGLGGVADHEPGARPGGPRVERAGGARRVDGGDVRRPCRADAQGGGERAGSRLAGRGGHRTGPCVSGRRRHANFPAYLFDLPEEMDAVACRSRRPGRGGGPRDTSQGPGS